MRLGADGSYLRWTPTGLARYLDGLLHAVEAALPTGDELIVYYNARRSPALFDGGARERFVRLKGAAPWHQVAVPIAARRDHVDVWLGAANILPVALRRPSVLVVHDCLAFVDPEAKPAGVSRHLRRWQRLSARAATRIAAVSSWTADQCAPALGVPRDKVTVVGEGVDGRFRPATSSTESATDAGLRAREGVLDEYVLQVGGFEAHKGGALADAALEVLRSRGHDVRLVRCGGGGPHRGRGTVDLGHVDEATLLALYRGASAVVVASTHEGFGLPVVEAMACGTPVVAVRAAALPETAGGAAVLVPPGDPIALAGGLERVLAGGPDVDDLRERGRRRVEGLRWDAVADRVLRLVEQASASRGGTTFLG